LAVLHLEEILVKLLESGSTGRNGLKLLLLLILDEIGPLSRRLGFERTGPQVLEADEHELWIVTRTLVTVESVKV
jgi:hypothetical protein